MTTLFGQNIAEYSVSDIALTLKKRVEEEFPYIRVRGEISQPKLHSSGHLYLRLKDHDAVLAAVCWRASVQRLAVKPEEGLEVIATGRLTTYPGQSQYQLVIDQMEAAGLGAILQMLEARKAKLAALGLFDPARKKPLPRYPRRIAVVTSPTGAVIRDILHRLSERWPVAVDVWPVAVQGDGAAVQIVKALRALAMAGPAHRPDVVIVARGGGSLEDLMPFFDEGVVMAAAELPYPLISAIGHETDTSFLDFVADQRAPTPTAAAEMATPVRRELLAFCRDKQSRMNQLMEQRLRQENMRLSGLARALPQPITLIETLTQRVDEWQERLQGAWQQGMHRRFQAVLLWQARLRQPADLLARLGERLQDRERNLEKAYTRRLERAGELLTRQAAMLESLSYTKVLSRGYAVVRVDGVVASERAVLEQAPQVEIIVQDGRVIR